MKLNKQERISLATEIKSRNFTWYYCIKDHQRHNARKAWQFCHDAGVPLNLLLELKFEQGQDCRDDTEMARRLARWVRIALTNMGYESYMLWTRHMTIGSKIENVAVLAHIPTIDLEHVGSLAAGWNIGREIEPVKVTYVDQSRCIKFNDEKWTAFDYIMRSMDPISRRHEPAALFQPSEPLFKPVFFQSKKIERQIRFLESFTNTIDN